MPKEIEYAIGCSDVFELSPGGNVSVRLELVRLPAEPEPPRPTPEPDPIPDPDPGCRERRRNRLRSGKRKRRRRGQGGGVEARVTVWLREGVGRRRRSGGRPWKKRADVVIRSKRARRIRLAVKIDGRKRLRRTIRLQRR